MSSLPISDVDAVDLLMNLRQSAAAPGSPAPGSSTQPGVVQRGGQAAPAPWSSTQSGVVQRGGQAPAAASVQNPASRLHAAREFLATVLPRGGSLIPHFHFVLSVLNEMDMRLCSAKDLILHQTQQMAQYGATLERRHNQVTTSSRLQHNAERDAAELRRHLAHALQQPGLSLEAAARNAAELRRQLAGAEQQLASSQAAARDAAELREQLSLSREGAAAAAGQAEDLRKRLENAEQQLAISRGAAAASAGQAEDLRQQLVDRQQLLALSREAAARYAEDLSQRLEIAEQQLALSRGAASAAAVQAEELLQSLENAEQQLALSRAEDQRKSSARRAQSGTAHAVSGGSKTQVRRLRTLTRALPRPLTLTRALDADTEARPRQWRARIATRAFGLASGVSLARLRSSGRR